MGRPGQVAAAQFERTIEAAERDGEIATYRARHRNQTLQQIAEHFGLRNKSTVHAAILRATTAAAARGGRELLGQQLVEADFAKQVVLEVLRSHHIIVSDGRVVYLGDQPLKDHKPVLMAVDRYMKILDHEAKLTGIYAPTKQTVTVLTEDVVDAALREAAAEHARLTAAPAPSTT